MLCIMYNCENNVQILKNVLFINMVILLVNDVIWMHHQQWVFFFLLVFPLKSYFGQWNNDLIL